MAVLQMVPQAVHLALSIRVVGEAVPLIKQEVPEEPLTAILPRLAVDWQEARVVIVAGAGAEAHMVEAAVRILITLPVTICQCAMYVRLLQWRWRRVQLCGHNNWHPSYESR